MKQLRADADVVLHGAGTVRADPLSARVPADLVEQRLARGLSAQPLGAIVTASGDLPAHHPYYQSATRIYMLSDRPVHVAGPHVEVCRVPDVAAVIQDLGNRGARRILCEGGPRLNASSVLQNTSPESIRSVSLRGCRSQRAGFATTIQSEGNLDVFCLVV